MKPQLPYLFTSVLLALAITGCQKNEPAAGPEPEVKHADNLVELTKANREHMTLKVEPVVLGNLGMTLKATGRVSANLNKTAKVTPTLEGRLTKINFDLNDRVKMGDVLALVESPELLGKALELKAPVDGVITERKATVGEMADRHAEVFTISDPTQLWVIAEIKERDLAAVKTGQEASFTVLPYPQETFHGQVVLLGNQVEAASRTLEVRLAVDNADGRLKPGMFADVAITTTLLENVLVIPDSALQTDGDQLIVFVALAGNKFERRVVKTGEEQAGRVQILAGLKTGEQVATEGGFILKSEMLKSELGED